MSDLYTMLRPQFSDLPLLATKQSCAGKTYIITGANIGLGFETAKHLISLGSHRVILAVRTQSRGEEALSAIESQTGIRGVGQVWQLDLSSYQSTIDFARRVERELDRVDAIVENAATATKEWVVTEGMESTILVNVTSTLLLAVLLLPHLEAGAKKFGIQPSIAIVTSSLGFTRQADLGKINRDKILQDVNDSSKFAVGGTDRYSLSKLLQVFAVRHLASVAPVSRTGVVINLVNPGLCSTGLVRNSDMSTKIQVSILRALVGRSAEWGSRSLLHGIVAGEKSHGQYLSTCDMNEKVVPGWVTNDDGQLWAKRVWDEVAAELERVQL